MHNGSYTCIGITSVMKVKLFYRHFSVTIVKPCYKLSWVVSASKVKKLDAYLRLANPLIYNVRPCLHIYDLAWKTKSLPQNMPNYWVCLKFLNICCVTTWNMYTFLMIPGLVKIHSWLLNNWWYNAQCAVTHTKHVHILCTLHIHVITLHA